MEGEQENNEDGDKDKKHVIVTHIFMTLFYDFKIKESYDFSYKCTACSYLAA